MPSSIRSIISTRSSTSQKIERAGQATILAGTTLAVATLLDPTRIGKAAGIITDFSGAVLVTGVKICRWCSRKIQEFKHRNCTDPTCDECWRKYVA
ncbi:hypothetical protein L207DRAFT_520340 [Hyaloscypha variabilis F]|uniref:Uncharacterized protein n=1 Tax=Hyaloscypha variabilis (strain UAMH 11265 / GT02V1 / F) TaxID=1149755 RepID=A0A2J6QVD5_HYAVF|nr:hypothetical protein L207DRAFT_520340 [Hyaloscypha variabilis F]